MAHSFACSAVVAAFLSVTAGHANAAGEAAQAGGTASPVLAAAPTQQAADQWRASKLAGVAVYGPDNKLVGKITDVLMSHDGRAEKVVVGVGGFLGLGQKDVALPFGEVTFTAEPIRPAPAAAMNDMAGASSAAGGMRPTMNGTAPNGGVDPAAPVGLGTPTGATTGGELGQAPPADTTAGVTALGAGASGADGVNPGAALPRSTAYPDHGTITMTADQLKSAPSFQFAQ